MMKLRRGGSYTWKSLGRHRGASLVELMIALAIGVMLLLGLIQVFGASRAAFSAAEGLSRVQESGRFVAEMLRFEMRMAGHLGCLNESAVLGVPGTEFQPPNPRVFNLLTANPSALNTAPFAFRLDAPVQGYEFSNTGPNANYLLGPVALAGDNFANPGLPGDLAAVAAEAVAGSDVLVLRYLSPDTIALGAIPVDPALGIVQVNPAESFRVQPGAIYGMSDCGRVVLFQARTAADPGTGAFNASRGGLNVSVTGPAGWDASLNYGVGSLVNLHRYVMSVYYVGIDAGGEPALFRRFVDPTIGAPFIGQREAIVEGVESMQLVFAVDTGFNGDGRMDDQPDIYATASAVEAAAAWRQVVSVRVGLLVRSPQRASDQSLVGRSVRVGETVITLPQDGRIRQVYEATVVPRNRVRG